MRDTPVLKVESVAETDPPTFFDWSRTAPKGGGAPALNLYNSSRSIL